MENFGSLSLGGVALPGQDILTESLWNSIAALGSDTALTGALGTRQSTVSQGSFAVKLEKPSFGTEVEANSEKNPDRRGHHSQIPAEAVKSGSNSAFGEISRAAFDPPSLFRQPIVTKATERDYGSEAAKDRPVQDSLTGLVKGAALVGDASRGTKTNFQSNTAVPAEHISHSNSDEYSDLVWRNSATGENAVWMMEGTTRSGTTSLPSVANPDWQLQGTGDFNQDGHSDLVWRNAATGENALWLMEGTNRSATAFLPPVANPEWQIRGIGDFNSDGHSDLVWRNTVTGENTLWLMQGTTRSITAFLPSVTNSDWQLQGTGDFDQDGHSDLVWRNLTTGENALWLMEGTTRSATAYLPTVANPDWQIRGIGDFNQDGHSDLVWRHAATGENALWLMQGTTRSITAFLPSVANPDWQISSTNYLAGSSSGFTPIRWSTVAPSPIGRAEAQGEVVDGKLYVFGGYVNTTYTPTRRSDVYDPASNTWKRIQDMSKGLTHSGTAADEENNDIYIAGGYIEQADGTGQNFATKNVWKYDVDTDTWTQMSSLPEPRGAGELAFLDGKLHFFGGVNSKRVDKNSHWVLSLGETRWTSAAPLPEPRNHLGDAVLNGKIYAIGGQVGREDLVNNQVSVYEWDPATPGIWTEAASLPRTRGHIAGATFVMDNKIIVAAGKSNGINNLSDMTAYDPLTNSWTPLTSLPRPRSSGVAGSVGNQIFYTTGAPGFGTTTYKGVVD